MVYTIINFSITAMRIFFSIVTEMFLFPCSIFPMLKRKFSCIRLFFLKQSLNNYKIFIKNKELFLPLSNIDLCSFVSCY